MVGGRIEIIRVADDLAVFRVADENQVVAVFERLLRLAMDVVDELAGCVEHLQAGRLCAAVE